MLTAVKNQTRVIFLSVKYNIMREMTNHVTFLMNVLFMILNNAAFIIQWMVLFQLKSNIGGYSQSDVLILWGIAASTYGASHILFHQVFGLSDLITNGKLDSFLVQPKNILLGVITSKTSCSAIGDLIYGYLIIIFFRGDPGSILLFTILTITGALIMAAFAVIVGSISFWIIRGDILAHNMNSAIVHFSTYPDGIFKGGVRFLLYTFIPVGLVNYLPLRIILEFNIMNFLILVGFTLFIITFAFFIFYRGLKRYSSSNLMIARI